MVLLQNTFLSVRAAEVTVSVKCCCTSVRSQVQILIQKPGMVVFVCKPSAGE